MALLTINEVAKKYGISKSNVDKKMRLGELVYTKDDDGVRRVDDEEVNRVFGEMLKKRSTNETVDALKGQPADPTKIVELLETKSKLAIAEAKSHLLEKRVYEVEEMLKSEKEEKKQWQDMANRLSLTFSGSLQGSSTGSIEDSIKIKEEAKKIKKKRSLISRLLGRGKGAT